MPTRFVPALKAERPGGAAGPQPRTVLSLRLCYLLELPVIHQASSVPPPNVGSSRGLRAWPWNVPWRAPPPPHHIQSACPPPAPVPRGPPSLRCSCPQGPDQHHSHRQTRPPGGTPPWPHTHRKRESKQDDLQRWSRPATPRGLRAPTRWLLGCTVSQSQ